MYIGFTGNSGTLNSSFTFNGPSGNPVNTQLPCHQFYNSIDITTDNQFFEYWGNDGTAVPMPLIQQGIAPTYATSGTGLTGYYAYCWTLVDANGNESQPSPLLATSLLANNGIILTIPASGITNIGNWTTIRIYRTLTNVATVVATSNPTFYHVPGLDTNLSGLPQTIAVDNVPDSTLQLPNNYQLTNVAYINGALAALPTTSVPRFLVSWNGQVWGGNWNNGALPIRVYWSSSVDNSQLSSGNCTSWNSFNYIDVGSIDDGNIIGMYPGLQGRLFIFKENATYIIQPTGNTSGIIYSSTPVSSEYGMYHHTIAEMGGAVIGRTRDNIMIFNGSSYKLAGAAPLIRKTLARCIQPEADSGVFDSNKQRYYLAVCDSEIESSYQTQITYNNGTNHTVTNIINCLRNSTIIFDVPTNAYETHHRTEIQVFGKLKDSSGREKVFGLGMSSDIHVLVEGNIFGPSYSFFGQYFGTNVILSDQINSTPPGANDTNAFLFIPFVINTDGQITFLDFSSQGIFSINHTSPDTAMEFTSFFPLPISSSATVPICLVPNQLDFVKSFSGGNITTLNNVYRASCSNNYSIYDFNIPFLYMNIDGGLKVNALQVLAPINESFSPSLSIGDQICLIPYRYFDNFQFRTPVPIQAFVTPPFGIRLDDMVRKAFEMFRLQIMGQGTLNIAMFLDGNDTYQYGPYGLGFSPDSTYSFVINQNPRTLVNSLGVPRSYQQMIYLKNQVGYYARFMIWCVRGSAWFEIQDFTAYYRKMEETASL